MFATSSSVLFRRRFSSRLIQKNGISKPNVSSTIVRSCMPEIKKTTYLSDLWDSDVAERLSNNPLGLLRYRSNLLGADLRITNFGGGNTSSKIELPDPFTRKPTRVLAVKGSGGDLGSITEAGFALLYQGRLEKLKALYSDGAHETKMGGYTPLWRFGQTG